MMCPHVLSPLYLKFTMVMVSVNCRQFNISHEGRLDIKACERHLKYCWHHFFMKGASLYGSKNAFLYVFIFVRYEYVL